MRRDFIALFLFEQDGQDIRVAKESHYHLVPADAVTDEDLVRYRRRLLEGLATQAVL